MIRSHGPWFLLLLVVCVAGPYLLGVRPRTNRQWTYIALTIVFMAWVVLLMAPLSSR